MQTVDGERTCERTWGRRRPLIGCSVFATHNSTFPRKHGRGWRSNLSGGGTGDGERAGGAAGHVPGPAGAASRARAPAVVCSACGRRRSRRAQVLRSVRGDERDVGRRRAQDGAGASAPPTAADAAAGTAQRRARDRERHRPAHRRRADSAAARHLDPDRLPRRHPAQVAGTRVAAALALSQCIPMAYRTLRRLFGFTALRSTFERRPRTCRRACWPRGVSTRRARRTRGRPRSGATTWARWTPSSPCTCCRSRRGRSPSVSLPVRPPC